MARVVVISDVHGNLQALRSVWKDVMRRRPDHVLFLGDLVAFGPDPAETLAFMRDEVKPSAALRGNTDRYLLEGVWKKNVKTSLPADIVASLKWTAARIGSDGLAYLDSLVGEHTYDLDGVAAFLCHAAPGNDEMPIGPDTVDDVSDTLKAIDASLLFCGHSHIPFRTRRNGLEVINAGSIGFPFDGDVRACYLSFLIGDGAMQELTFCRVSYPRGQTLERIEASDIPAKSLFAHRLRTARQGAPKPVPAPVD